MHYHSHPKTDGYGETSGRLQELGLVFASFLLKVVSSIVDKRVNFIRGRRPWSSLVVIYRYHYHRHVIAQGNKKLKELMFAETFPSRVVVLTSACKLIHF